MKYQFCIRFKNIDANSAASKAVVDCNRIFSLLGYKDYTLTVGDNSNKLTYYPTLFKELLRFFIAVKPGSTVGIQYPLLSINNFFKYFMALARLKKVKFFCVIHDLESLRTGGLNEMEIKQEIDNLNIYDVVIVHNDRMRGWLEKHSLKCKTVTLGLFDYLCPYNLDLKGDYSGAIVFAGNLGKSTFIYELGGINKKFDLYGPNFKQDKLRSIENVTWKGEYSPEQIPGALQGSFGLIWDGVHVEACDEVMGNYLNYNNPHKASLYLAAGLPLIAPVNSAIGLFIQATGTGILINSLYELTTLIIEQNEYQLMVKNVSRIQDMVINGYYFTEAVKSAEQYENN